MDYKSFCVISFDWIAYALERQLHASVFVYLCIWIRNERNLDCEIIIAIAFGFDGIS